MSSAKSFDILHHGQQTGSHRRHACSTLPVMAYATYIGRVGALAVALGVGAAVAGFGGTAWADDTADATTKSDSGQNAGPADPTGTDAATGGTWQTLVDPRATNPAIPKLNWPDLHLPQGSVRSSGGLHGARQSGVAQSGVATPAAKLDPTPAPEVLGQQPVSDPSEGAPIEVTADTAGLDAPTVVHPQRSRTPVLGSTTGAATLAAPAQSGQPLSQITGEVSNRVQRAVDDATAAIAASSDSLTAMTNASISAASEGVNDSGLKLADTTALPSQPSAQVMAAAPADPVTQVVSDPVTQLVSGLLAMVGLNPDATDTPVPEPPPQTLLGVLELIRREFERLFFNQTPTLAPTTNSLLVDGRITGDLHPNDPDSAILTYTATDPANGSVVVNPDGTFIYTPDAGSSGPDSFQVTVSDAALGNGFQIHGLSGLLNVVTFGLLGEGGYTSTENVAVNVAPQQGLPAGFVRTVLVSGLNAPTDFRFLPDGRILIAERSGAIQVYNNGQLQSQPLITLPTNSADERGLLAIEVDPKFSDNGYIYVSYTTAANHDRLSRLTVTNPAAAVLTAELTSELKLMEGDQLDNASHHGAAIHFGPDGKLYWSMGDNFGYMISQDLSNIYGKILRLNPDGTVPTDNPFFNTPGALPQIYAYGFRNPFRFTFTPNGELLVADVGEVSWEELNNVTAGGNYGWPLAEGVCPGVGVCVPGVPAGSLVNPIYAYPNSVPAFNPGASITDVLVYTGSTFPESYQNKVFIADFVQGWIKELTCNSDYSSCGSAKMFDSGTGLYDGPVALLQGTDGNIYELQTVSGVLSRIALSGDGLPIAEG